MKSNEQTKFVNGHRYTLEYKSANMSAIMKNLDKRVKDGQIRIKRSDNKTTYSISESELKQVYIESLLDEPMIKIFLNYKGYSNMTDSDKGNWISFDNGKTSIEILAEYRSCFPWRYEFIEHYENEDIVSKGCFPFKESGVNYLQFDHNDIRSYYYFNNQDYKGSEYFRQAFLYDNKLATISFIVKKVAEHPSWCCTYPEFSVSIVVGYYDLENNQSLNGLSTDTIFEYTSLADNFFLSKVIPNFTDTISIVPSVCDDNAHWDSSFFSDRIEGLQEPIQKGLSKAYRKVERYFVTKLEKKENLGFVKKLIPNKNKGNK